MNDITSEHSNRIYEQIRGILTNARARVWQTVNHEMVCCYWEIGRVLVEDEQRGKERAEYGRKVVSDLSVRLTGEFGKGFDQRNLWFMRHLYSTYPKVNALRSELSWTHYRHSASRG